MGNKYIYNKHIAPVTANARDGKGVVLFTKKFLPEQIDGTTGRVISTGYTTLTDEEYDQLCNGSKTFVHYSEKLKLLAVCDDLPPEAKTPQEALVDARRKEREAEAKAATLTAENDNLKARLLEAEDKFKQLSSASTAEEKLKPLNDKIASLEADKAEMLTSIDVLVKERDQLRASLEKTGKKGKDFE